MNFGELSQSIKITNTRCSESGYEISIEIDRLYNNIVGSSLWIYDIKKEVYTDISSLLPPISISPTSFQILIPYDYLERIGKLYLSIEVLTNVGDFSYVREYYNFRYIGEIGRYIDCFIKSLRELKIENCKVACNECDKCDDYVYIIGNLLDILKYGLHRSIDEIIRDTLKELEYYCGFCNDCIEDKKICICDECFKF